MPKRQVVRKKRARAKSTAKARFIRADVERLNALVNELGKKQKTPIKVVRGK